MKKINLIILWLCFHINFVGAHFDEKEELLEATKTYRFYATQLNIFINEEHRRDLENKYILDVLKLTTELESNARWMLIKVKKSDDIHSAELKSYFHKWLSYKYNRAVKFIPYHGYRYPRRIDHGLKMIKSFHSQLATHFSNQVTSTSAHNN